MKTNLTSFKTFRLILLICCYPRYAVVEKFHLIWICALTFYDKKRAGSYHWFLPLNFPIPFCFQGFSRPLGLLKLPR